jgi:hypothetical protein
MPESTLSAIILRLSSLIYSLRFDIEDFNPDKTNEKKGAFYGGTFILDIKSLNYFNFSSGETVSFFLPLALREARTLFPLDVDILSLKPCLFALFLLEG